MFKIKSIALLRVLKATITIVMIALLWLFVATQLGVKEVPNTPKSVYANEQTLEIHARDGTVLSRSYQTRWNNHQQTTIQKAPDLLVNAFLISEDRRFHQHSGVDWFARFAALWANVKNARKVRGASTITEQVVRMIHPRKRTLWSRWIEGFEAAQLERKWSKQNILEFYLNQVPFASNRRGIVQAAQYYFDRSLDTLNAKETLALAVLVRAPSRYDLWNDVSIVDSSITRLGERMLESATLKNQHWQIERLTVQSLAQPLAVRVNELELYVPEFVAYVRDEVKKPTAVNRTPRLITTLDPVVQRLAQQLLDQRLQELKQKKLNNGAVLVVDRNDGQVLAWANGAHRSEQNYARKIDAVTVKRQVGSVLKPLVYALALEQGWSAASLINDEPMNTTVGHGQHTYRNYSGRHYGQITLRNALGNSLNIPAVRAVEHVGIENYLKFLHSFSQLKLRNDADHYGSGIALGNIELSLFDVVGLYTSLARAGRKIALSVVPSSDRSEQQALKPSTALIITDILQDSSARELEFGYESILNFPIRTAIKTGTSTDYRDSWVIAYDQHYIIGAWMGNLDGSASVGVTGSKGPAIVVRSLFDQLRQRPNSKLSTPIAFERKSGELIRLPVCRETGQIQQTDQNCEVYREWFPAVFSARSFVNNNPVAHRNDKSYLHNQSVSAHVQENNQLTKVELINPNNGLHIALDPRTPREAQAYEFLLAGVENNDRIVWHINQKKIFSEGSSLLWPIKKGTWTVKADVYRNGSLLSSSNQVDFLVK